MIHDMTWQSAASMVLNIVIYAGMGQGFFLALVLTTKKNKNRRPNRMLAILLVILSISILHSIVGYGNVAGPYKIKEPLILLVGPLLLFYVREFTGIENKGFGYFPHFIPFLLCFVAFFGGHFLAGVPPYADTIKDNSKALSVGLWVLIVAQFGFYWLKTVRTIHRNIAAVESEYSSTEGKTFSWLGTFVHIFGVLLVLFGGTVAFAVHTSHYALVDTIVSFGLACVIFVLGYQGLFQEAIFLVAGLSPALEEPATRQIVRPEVNSEAAGKLAENLTACIEEKKPYLDDRLTLSKLAEQLGTTRNQLSSIINSRFGSNFYNFINRYRVEEVKRLIADPRNRDFTILSLAFQAGFPSKSSFHEIFKKQTGMTPSQYQESLRQSEESSNYTLL